MSPLARTILATVEAEPDQWTRRMLADDLDVTPGAVRHALRVLRCRGHAPRVLDRRGQKAAAILAYLRDEPGLTTSAIAALTGASARRVRQVAARLRTQT